jgi:hypothetical protein
VTNNLNFLHRGNISQYQWALLTQCLATQTICWELRCIDFHRMIWFEIRSGRNTAN